MFESRRPDHAPDMLLELDDISAGYGTAQVLFGVRLAIAPGEVVGLLGRNGMGKTTTIWTVMGRLRPRAGTIRFDGRRIDGLAPFAIARLGIGLVPEGRRVFTDLTVRENLLATARPAAGNAGGWDLEAVLALFPPLAERLDQLADRLSGGEQQMLAIGRALVTNPRLLILDEATEGLAPLVRREIWRVLAALKERGQAILVVDKNVRALARLADRFCVLQKGRVAWSGTPSALLADRELWNRLLGV